jgi:hypothetical protein
MQEKGMHLIRAEKNIYIQLMLTPTTITRTGPLSPLNLYMFPKCANHQTQHSLKQDDRQNGLQLVACCSLKRFAGSDHRGKKTKSADGSLR